MKNTNPTLAAVARQEHTLQFDAFTSDTALALGNTVVDLARQTGKSVAVDISGEAGQLFYHGMAGTDAGHADWIRRKSNLVKRTGHSSFYISTEVSTNGGNIDAVPGLDNGEFAAHGGSFPLVVRGKGAVGTITVSGLPGADDHALVVQALETYLKKGSL